MQEQNLDQRLASFCQRTCRNPDFSFEASPGLGQNLLPAFLNLTQQHAPGTDSALNHQPATLAAQNPYQQTTVISSFACDPSLGSAESAPVWNAGEPWSGNLRSATHSSHTLRLFIADPGGGIT